MIEVEQLTKSYGTVQALRGLSFHVGKNEVVGVLGPNGAGKSTTLRILAGFLGASSGRVTIAGHDVATDSVEARRAIGYMPETAPLYPEMRVAEYLGFRAELKRVGSKARGAAVERALTDAGASDFADVPIAQLSKGYRQRVGLADALVASPPILILDEPTAGLDPNQIREVRALIRRLGERHTVLVSTHILSEVEQSCTRALVIARGELVAEGTMDELRARSRSLGLELLVRAPGREALDTAMTQLASLDGIAKARSEAADEGEAFSLRVRLESGADAKAVMESVIAALVRAGVGVREAKTQSSTLEQVFSALTEQKS